MATAIVMNIIKQIKKLSSEEKEELQSALVPVLPKLRLKATEEDFRKALTTAGLLASPAANARAKTARRRPFKPVAVRGQPVSETLIEERR